MTKLNINIDNVINNLDGIIFIKDCNFKYITANNAFLDLCDVSSKKDLAGINDSDLITRKHQHFYRKCDQQVLKLNDVVSVTEPLYKNNDVFIMKTTKKPLYNEKKEVIGIIAQAYIIDIIQSNPSNSTNPHSNSFPNLTKRQHDCLYYYTTGMSLKEIGKVLNLSPKTIANYLENIKNKLNCFTRSDLVKKALQLGMLTNVLDVN